MKWLRKTLLRVGLLGGAAYVLYTYGLSDEAKEALTRALKSARDAYNTIQDLMVDVSGQVVEEEYLPNTELTRKQWEALGL